MTVFKKLIDANINSSSREMLVKSESTSKLPINNVGSCSHISSANWNESLTVYSFLFKGFNMETKSLARLYVGVCRAHKITRNWGQPSTCCLCTSGNQARYYVWKLQGTLTTSRCLPPPFRPILSALQIPTYNLARF